ncbi:cilia- and flagella-associated protein 44 isoform X3 [Oryzias latipes]|uniref:cilia- and flagella-associated protein 44 isoform X3 n=1 Tax=Oryzias latipes TaxID=8090 RepID=UPI0009D9240D|nr:cilia- and flagella-associated protein 44 isoform X3 [Oryzias latipes]
MSDPNAGGTSETASQKSTKDGSLPTGSSPQLPEMQQEAEEEAKQQLSAHMSYKYEELRSRASVSPGLDIPEDLLHLSHSFGFDSRRRANLGVLDDSTLIFIAGNLMVLLDVHAQEQRFLRSSGGGGIGAIAVHPSREFFAVAEKGTSPDIIVYEYPSLRPGRILRGGTRHRYSCVSFNHDGSLLASVGGEPDFLLTLWDWRREEVQSFQATSQEVHRVSFSHYDQELLTTAGCRHINFWKLSTTFTGFKLEKLAGHFGNSVASDIEGVLELPDGEVVSGTEWGNLLLWDGNSIKAEICCKDGRSCHSGTAQPFALEGGKLLTFGSDGAVRSWDFERISSFTCDGGGSRLEVEPINELVVGRHVCLSSVVKSSLPGSSVWFAQDSNGGIWNLDLSFSPSAADPRRLLSCPSGPIKGLDVSKTSHLMATTALDCSVRVFDLLAKREVTSSCFNQGGTALSWAPLTVNQKGGLLVTGFEDGVVRLLELRADSGVSAEEHTRLHLKQALKPHSAAVTAVAFQPDGHILATGSEDQTVFFFTVGEACHPLGFIHVPGPVQALEWSPDSHLPQNGRRLLILCRSGHALEVESPDLEAERSPQSFHLPELPRRCFGFSSITSRMKRPAGTSRPQTERMKIRREEVEKQEGEKPQPPGPLLCGFYSEPGQFWLSMGGFDSGYLYHCKFSEDQSEEPCRRQDEPFDFLLVSGADDDPICSMTFSSSRQLLLCGMHSGTIRVYPLRPGDLAPADMQAYWALSVHDNHYGHLRHIRCSFDDLFVLTAGDDGNIFSFSRVPPEESQRGLQRQRARIPSPRQAYQETESSAVDIQDPEAFSLEAAKQKQDQDLLRRKADQKAAQTRIQLAELREKFKLVLAENQHLPERVRLTPEELNPLLYEKAKRMTAERVMKVRQQMAKEQERCSMALRKLQEWSKSSSEALSVITVVGVRSGIRVSTYHVSANTEHRPHRRASATEAPPDSEEPEADPADSAATQEAAEKQVPRPPVPPPPRVRGRGQDTVRLRKVAERAERVRATMERRRQEWARLYAEKPQEDFEDPLDVLEIQEAKKNIGDVIVVKPPTMCAEGKKEEWNAWEEKIIQQKSEMNRRITNLRDAKIRLVSWLSAQAKRLQKIHHGLGTDLRRSPPPLPSMSPEEMPERKLQCSSATLDGYRAPTRRAGTEQEVPPGADSSLKAEEKDKQERNERTLSLSASSELREEEQLTPLEKELQQEEEIRRLHQQDTLLQQMESSISRFDSELLLLRQQKVRLDIHLKQADLHLLTLFQETVILGSFEEREASLQEKLNRIVEERRSIEFQLQGYSEQLKQRRRVIEELQEDEEALAADFQASVAENHHYEDLLTKIFKKKAARKKKEKRAGSPSEEDSDDSLEDWDGCIDSDMEEEDGSSVDDKVCPTGCDPDLFRKILQLRERRWDLEEMLVEAGKSADALKKESDGLITKGKVLKSSQQRIEEEVELINKDKLQKMKQVEVVVPFRLHQIQFLSNGSVPSDLSEALVLDKSEMDRLRRRVQQLQVEKEAEEGRLLQAQRQRSRLIRENKEMTVRLQELEKQCNELMMLKYGRLLDVEALLSMSGQKKLDKLKEEKLLLEAEHAKELKRWKAKVEEARHALWDATEQNTGVLRSTVHLTDQKKELRSKLSSRQKNMDKLQFQDHRRLEDREDIRKLQELVQAQEQQAQALLRRIHLLSSKEGCVLPPETTRLPPLAPAHGPLPSTRGRPLRGHDD